MASAKRVRIAVDKSALFAKACAAIEGAGFVKITSLGPKDVRADLTRELRGAGFEATKTVVRRPIAAQLADAFAQGAQVSMKSIGGVVRGATAAETKRAALELIQDGTLRLVLRGSAEVVVPGNAAVLSREQIVAARRTLDSLCKLLAKVVKHKAKASVLRADVLEAIEHAAAELAPRELPRGGLVESAPPNRRGARSAVERVLSELDAARDETMGMSFVPHIVSRLRPDMDAAVVWDALSEAASEGLVELRPEGGLGRLSQEELDACLPGPQGTRLSWARRVEGGS